VRVPHFIGLHAIQALALLALAVRRWRRPEETRVRAVLAGAASYALLFLLLLWGALRGDSVLSRDALSLASLGGWLAVTAISLGWVALASRGASRAPSNGLRT
jgi:hypothetical protein